MSTIKRAWLLFVPDNGDDANDVADKINDVAKDIWDDTNRGKPFKKACKEACKKKGINYADLKLGNLERGWVVRADVVNRTKIMVPVVGQATATNVDPIDLIVYAIKIVHNIQQWAVDRFVVEERQHHHPSEGYGNDDPVAEPLNAWG